MENSLQSYALPSASASFVNKYTNVLMLFFPITTFVLAPSVPGSTIINVLSALLFGLIPFCSLGGAKGRFYTELAYFFGVILLLSFCSQFINLVLNLKLVNTILLNNKKNLTKTFYRPSHITQSITLIVGFIIYAYVKYFSTEKIINYIYWGLRLLCIYGLYEFLLYMLTGQNGDFVVNRTFGEGEKSASLFQTLSLGGIGMMRIKSYTGEPSMFVFTVFPFWVLTFGLNRKFDQLLMLGCLILTFSTTAYMCMILFYSCWIIYKRNFTIFYYISILIIVFCLVLQLNAFKHLLDSMYNFIFVGKLGGESSSSQQRSGAFTEHLFYWSTLNPLNQAFGIGFGYVRSTDFFSTLIVNNGLVGLIVFTWFTLKNIGLKIASPIISLCYKLGLVFVYLIMMASVPEFGYPSLWIYIALGFVIKHMKFETVNTSEIVNNNVLSENIGMKPVLTGIAPAGKQIAR
ncbi:hypothetical protein [Mucilaginibacter pallidiroseus]|nr:hypothetical protein [Mucilaginibacter pallidiroseus]